VCRLSIPAFHVVDVRWVREQVDIVDSPPPVFVCDVTFKATVCVLAGCSPIVAGAVAVIVRAHRDAGTAEPGAGYTT
jgi:hypothetical protein